MLLSRRGLLGSLLAAPVIIRSGVLMPVKPLVRYPVTAIINSKGFYLNNRSNSIIPPDESSIVELRYQDNTVWQSDGKGQWYCFDIKINEKVM